MLHHVDDGIGFAVRVKQAEPCGSTFRNIAPLEGKNAQDSDSYPASGIRNVHGRYLP